MTNFNPCAGMRPGTSEADRQLVKWVFSQPPFNRQPYKTYDPEAERQFINAVIKMGTLPPNTKEHDFSNPANRQFARACLTLQKNNLPLTLKTIGEQLRFDEFGPYYYEIAFLSCVLAGGEIPDTVAETVFYDPRNKILFRAMKHLKLLGILNYSCLISFLSEFGVLWKCGGRAYLTKLESTMPVDYAVNSLAIVLLEKAVMREAA
jgi:replicative DNA helicase